jgi:hypothetical protein
MAEFQCSTCHQRLSLKVCRTCGQPLPKDCRACGQPLLRYCQCPVPDPPEVLTTVVALREADRTRKIAAISILLAYVDMDVAPVALNEALEQVRAAFLPAAVPRARHRPKGSGTYKDSAEFLTVLIPIAQNIRADQMYPSQARVAENWTGHHSTKQIQRWFSQYVTIPLG